MVKNEILRKDRISLQNFEFLPDKNWLKDNADLYVDELSISLKGLLKTLLLLTIQSINPFIVNKYDISPFHPFTVFILWV